MKQVSSESLSDEYLHVNSCGKQTFNGSAASGLRPFGRIDYHILYIAEGCCFVTVNGETVRAQAGSVIVFLPKQRQEYGFTKDIKSTSYYIHFSGTACAELMEKFHMTDRNIYTAKLSENLIGLFEALIAEHRLKLNFYDYTCESLLLNILAVLGRIISHRDAEDQMPSTPIWDICRKIISNPASKLTVGDYAKMCNLSESRFSHLFKEVIGKSPKKYILDSKLETAKELLVNTGMSVAQVADNLGFSDANYFSRLFKKEVGFSPLNFAKKSASKL